MKSTKLLLSMAAMAAVLGLSACGQNNDKKSEDFGYKLTVNGRTTEQKFSSREDLCRGLQNETLNDGVAQESRARLFAENCPGRFSPFWDNQPQRPIDGGRPDNRNGDQNQPEPLPGQDDQDQGQDDQGDNVDEGQTDEDIQPPLVDEDDNGNGDLPDDEEGK